MDTGDAGGDLYFFLGQFLLPLECNTSNSTPSRAHFDCDNPERLDPHRVATRLELQVDKRFTDYFACNLCNGTDPFTGKTCVNGTYICDCEERMSHQGVCDRTKVGVNNVTHSFAPTIPTEQCEATLDSLCGDVKEDMNKCWMCTKAHSKQLSAATCEKMDVFEFCPSQWLRCGSTSDEWPCWYENLPRKTNGFWYSTLAEGQCNETSAPGSCSWKVQSMKTIKASCLKKKFEFEIESRDPGCFQSCGPRNVSSSCYIGCFFDIVLGKDARHSSRLPLGGISRDDLVRTWNDAFQPANEGGCEEQFLHSGEMQPAAIVV